MDLDDLLDGWVLEPVDPEDLPQDDWMIDGVEWPEIDGSAPESGGPRDDVEDPIDDPYPRVPEGEIALVASAAGGDGSREMESFDDTPSRSEQRWIELEKGDDPELVDRVVAAMADLERLKDTGDEARPGAAREASRRLVRTALDPTEDATLRLAVLEALTDFNGDGFVSARDIADFQSAADSADPGAMDVDGDGRFTGLDMELFTDLVRAAESIHSDA